MGRMRGYQHVVDLYRFNGAAHQDLEALDHNESRFGPEPQAQVAVQEFLQHLRIGYKGVRMLGNEFEYFRAGSLERMEFARRIDGDVRVNEEAVHRPR